MSGLFRLRKKITSTAMSANPMIAARPKDCASCAGVRAAFRVAPGFRNFDEDAIAGNFVALHLQLHADVRARRGGFSLRGVERGLLLPLKEVVGSRGLFIAVRFDQIPIREIHAFPVAQKYFRARLGLFFREIRAGSFFVERVMDGMERAVRLQDDHVFFILRIAEIADRPEGGGNLIAINAVGGGDADRAAQIFIHVIVKCVGDCCGVVIGGRIDVDLAQILVAEGGGFPGVDLEADKISDGFPLYSDE